MRSEPQFIHAPGGDEMVVLTRADYDDLVARAAEADEDEADAALFDERMADLKAGRDVVLPAEVSRLVLKGATLPRALRKWRGLTQVQLAEMTGLAQSYLSELEAQEGKRERPRRGSRSPRPWTCRRTGWPATTLNGSGGNGRKGWSAAICQDQPSL